MGEAAAGPAPRGGRTAPVRARDPQRPTAAPSRRGGAGPAPAPAAAPASDRAARAHRTAERRTAARAAGGTGAAAGGRSRRDVRLGPAVAGSPAAFLAGALHAGVEEDLRGFLEKVAAAAAGDEVVLDCSGVSFIGPTCLSVLRDAALALGTAGRPLVLANARQGVRDLAVADGGTIGLDALDARLPRAACLGRADQITPLLADAIVNQLFGVGLALAAASSTDGHDGKAVRLDAAIDELDDVIQEIQFAVIGQRIANLD